MVSQNTSVRDTMARPLRDLRLSVIDRCNFRCTYCMPEEIFKDKDLFLRKQQMMSYQEMLQLVVIFARLGVRKIRLTGGEPLLRQDLPELIRGIRDIEGIEDIALTTNGILLPRMADKLADTGLKRITVSLDTLDTQVFHAMNGHRSSVDEVLAGIAAAEEAGFTQLKINTVVQKGVNDHTVMDILQHFRGTGHCVRLIEYMDVGNSNHWKEDQVVPSGEWLERIQQRWPVMAVSDHPPGAVARMYRYLDRKGEVGFISSISQPFCSGCNRARVTADAMLYTCLFASHGTALMPLLRNTDDLQALEDRVRDVWLGRTDRYSEERQALRVDGPKVEMYRMGG